MSRVYTYSIDARILSICIEQYKPYNKKNKTKKKMRKKTTIEGILFIYVLYIKDNKKLNFKIGFQFLSFFFYIFLLNT